MCRYLYRRGLSLGVSSSRLLLDDILEYLVSICFNAQCIDACLSRCEKAVSFEQFVPFSR